MSSDRVSLQVRMPATLKEMIIESARKNGRSVNSEISRRLSISVLRSEAPAVAAFLARRQEIEL